MRFLSAALFTGATLSANMARAADLPSQPIAPVYSDIAPLFTVTVAAGPKMATSFPGSKSYTVLPNLHLAYLKPGELERFHTSDDSFGITLYDNGFFRAGPVANIVDRRGLSNGNGQFYGLHNVSTSVELGAFAELWPWRDHLRVRGEIRQAVSGHDGLVGSIGIDGVQKIGPLQVSLGPRVKFGDQHYVDSYFTVAPSEAALNGRVNPYAAKGGLTSVGAFASARYDINPKYSVSVFGGYDRLSGSAGDSPVATVLGTRDQFTAGIALGYTFGFKGIGIWGY